MTEPPDWPQPQVGSDISECRTLGGRLPEHGLDELNCGRGLRLVLAHALRQAPARHELVEVAALVRVGMSSARDDERLAGGT